MEKLLYSIFLTIQQLNADFFSDDNDLMLRFARNPENADFMLRFAKRSTPDQDHMLRFMRQNVDDHLLRFGKRHPMSRLLLRVL